MKPERLAEHILDAASLPADKIRLACAHCGIYRDVAKEPHDPRPAVLALSNECPRCQAAQGGFGNIDYFDAHSSVVVAEQEPSDG
jgi:hypothetical protein